tara:strand:+ start:230 stop:496 length:267 start_codon:yes stop_codon:yes gene_type:complete
VEKSINPISKQAARRQRQHELLIALIQQQESLELMEAEAPSFDGIYGNENDPARWIDRNRRILERYQSLVKSAITLDALLESEQSISE